MDVPDARDNYLLGAWNSIKPLFLFPDPFWIDAELPELVESDALATQFSWNDITTDEFIKVCLLN